MTPDSLPYLIMTRAGLGSLIVVSIFVAISWLAGLLNRKAGNRDLLGAAIGGAMIFGVPGGIAIFAGLLASAFLVAIGAPPPTYLFLLGLAALSLRAAAKHPGNGMEGCTKIIGVVWSGYAIIWSLVSFEATGGVAALQAGDIDPLWVQPLISALPFALLALRVADRKKRSLWLFLGTLVVLSAVAAVVFLPVERGFAEQLLPASDWLRFPLAGLAVAAAFTLTRIVIAWNNKPNIRRIRLRDLRFSTRILATLFLLLGLSWATARQALLLIG